MAKESLVAVRTRPCVCGSMTGAAGCVLPVIASNTTPSYAPETIFSDEESINIGREAKAACDARPWLQSQTTPKPSWRARTAKWIAHLFVL
ncbi:MAG: hypothetical protein WBB01_09640 [Phormidesmis sp.]